MNENSEYYRNVIQIRRNNYFNLTKVYKYSPNTIIQANSILIYQLLKYRIIHIILILLI